MNGEQEDYVRVRDKPYLSFEDIKGTDGVRDIRDQIIMDWVRLSLPIEMTDDAVKVISPADDFLVARNMAIYDQKEGYLAIQHNGEKQVVLAEVPRIIGLRPQMSVNIRLSTRPDTDGRFILCPGELTVDALREAARDYTQLVFYDPTPRDAEVLRKNDR